MAMTLQGSVLTNGNTATNFVPLKLEPNNKDSPEVFLNEASNGFGDCEKNGLNNGEVIEEVKETPSEEPVIDITINNVVCSFSVKSHLNLKQIAQSGYNVEYRRENGVRFSHSLKLFSQFLDFNLRFCCRW
jgi:transcription initiation factor TFIID TATA-box-binding protein